MNRSCHLRVCLAVRWRAPRSLSSLPASWSRQLSRNEFANERLQALVVALHSGFCFEVVRNPTDRVSFDAIEEVASIRFVLGACHHRDERNKLQRFECPSIVPMKILRWPIGCSRALPDPKRRSPTRQFTAWRVRSLAETLAEAPAASPVS